MLPRITTYKLYWRWATDMPPTRQYVDELQARTAQTAIDRLRSNLKTEYEFRPNDLVIIAVVPKDW